MAILDWSQCPAVESIPGKVSGTWVFRDTRLPVATTVSVALLPAVTVCDCGGVVIAGAVLTVRVAAVVSTLPKELKARQLYCEPL